MIKTLKNFIPLALIVAAAAVALATLLSDHSDDYGKVSLPAGGVVDLPKGTTTVFHRQEGQTSPTGQGVPVSFQVTPASGGAPLPIRFTGDGGSDTGVTRSETIGELGAVAKVDVPAAGYYAVHGSAGGPAGSSHLDFGTNAATAVARKWRLFAGLIGAALLISLMPTPRRRRRGSGDFSGWSADSSAPYARAHGK